MSFDSSYDVIIIGSGLGGLGAALTLAVKDKRVLLLEQHNLQGGFASSFVRGRFEFEVALHEMADVGGPEEENKGPIRYFLKDEGGIDVEFIPIPDAYHLILTGEHKLNAKFPFGPEEYIDAVCAAVPETWDALLSTPIPKAMNTIPPTKIAIEIIARPRNLLRCMSHLLHHSSFKFFYIKIE